MSVIGMKIELTEFENKPMEEIMQFFSEVCGFEPALVEKSNDGIVGLKYKEHEIFPIHEENKWFISMFEDPERISMTLSEVCGVRDSLIDYVITRMGMNNFGEIHVVSKRLKSPVNEPITYD